MNPNDLKKFDAEIDVFSRMIQNNETAYQEIVRIWSSLKKNIEFYDKFFQMFCACHIKEDGSAVDSDTFAETQEEAWEKLAAVKGYKKLTYSQMKNWFIPKMETEGWYVAKTFIGAMGKGK